MRKHDPIPAPETLTTTSLLEWLKASNGSDRSDAAEELGARRIVSAWRPLCRLLRDPYWVARCSAAESLGMIRAPMSIPYLRRALKTLNPGAAALCNLGDSEKLSEVIQALTAPNYRTQGSAANYLAGIARPKDAPQAIAGLQKAIAAENPARIADFRRAIRELRQLQA